MSRGYRLKLRVASIAISTLVIASPYLKEHYEPVQGSRIELHTRLSTQVTQCRYTDDCDRPIKARGLCKNHYDQAKKRGELHHYPYVRKFRPAGEICSVSGCDLPVLARDWCSMHYKRWEKRGEVGDATPRRFDGGRIITCSVPGCQVVGSTHPKLREAGDLPRMAGGMCRPHHDAFEKYGDPSRAGHKSGEMNHLWRGDEISYAGVHARLAKARGPARAHQCVKCGRQARDWAYNGLDPQERYGSRGGDEGFSLYSLNFDFYEPLCRRCHLIQDRAKNVADLHQFRLRQCAERSKTIQPGDEK